ncbi:MAG TPA: hypothetical protein PLM06_13535, partial [Anaerolineae bacterium]|nr:hypothetical protein [Anaerolineae bacterium]
EINLGRRRSGGYLRRFGDDNGNFHRPSFFENRDQRVSRQRISEKAKRRISEKKSLAWQM